MLGTGKHIGVAVLLLALGTAPAYAGRREVGTVDAAAEVLKEMCAIRLKFIPPALLHDAKAVAIFPHVMKVGLLVDRRFGRGVVLMRQPDGSWSNPVLLTIDGGGFGLEAGIESTDLVLVFKTAGSVDRMLKGRLTLGTDVSVAAGPIGREAEIAGDGRLLPEIFSYSRSRGLFAGLALEGARLCVDGRAEESFYGLRGCRPEDVLAGRGNHVAAAENLKAELTRLTTPQPPAPPVLLVPR